MDYLHALLRLLLCLPVVLVLAYLFIKYGLVKSYKGRGNMQVIDQIALSPRATLNVVKVADDYYLIGATEKQITLIKHLPCYQLGIAEEPKGFAGLVSEFTRGKAHE
ncbi:MAG: flagellar biosynthetic protein FliO [Syntrophomonadaceae bacterium]|jgi:flagellar protein FliO/FliZ